jgi:hypothetical protein
MTAMQYYFKPVLPHILLALVLCLTAAGAWSAETPPADSQAQTAQDVQALHEMINGFRQHEGPQHAWVAIISVLAVFGTPVMFVALGLWSKHKRQQMIHQTISQMVEKGLQIPPELLRDEKTHEPRSALHKGVIMTAVGLGMLCLFLVLNIKPGIGISFIPLFLGLAYLLIWRIEKPRI